MRLTFALAVTLVASTAAAQDERPAECLFVTIGREWINGECIFSPIGDDGSFQIMALDGSTFAQVLMNKPGSGNGYWNGGGGSGHAHNSLGVLIRNDACWDNVEAMVCAW